MIVKPYSFPFAPWNYNFLAIGLNSWMRVSVIHPGISRTNINLGTSRIDLHRPVRCQSISWKGHKQSEKQSSRAQELWDCLWSKLALRHREGVDNSSNLRSYTPTQKKHIKVNDVKWVKWMKTNIMSYDFNIIIGFAQEDYSDDCL